MTRPPELLSPAGSWDCARAAVENGADAIYFGTESFNARMRADNFRLTDLPELAAWLHGRGVRGYLTFNTLVFPSEMEEAERFLRAAIGAGLDAAIVQDVGVCCLIREISPDFPIHASTQMTIASAAGARLARELGCSTVVLARENTLAEMARIREDLAQEPVGLEVFVHGALCVAYSGQCLTSEALGGNPDSTITGTFRPCTSPRRYVTRSSPDPSGSCMSRRMTSGVWPTSQSRASTSVPAAWVE